MAPALGVDTDMPSLSVYYDDVFLAHDPPGGAFVDIEHNTVLATSRYGSRRHRVPSVKVGVSTDTSTVRRNWFFQNASLAIWQGRVHGPPYDAAKYDNLVVQDNSFGRHVPPAGVGAFAGTNASATAC